MYVWMVLGSKRYLCLIPSSSLFPDFVYVETVMVTCPGAVLCDGWTSEVAVSSVQLVLTDEDGVDPAERLYDIANLLR
jgi:hypothetical protein